MGREDWDYIQIPKTMVKRIDDIVKEKKKKGGVVSRAELIRSILEKFLNENRFD